MNSRNLAKSFYFNLFSKNKVFKLVLFTFAVVGGLFIFSFSASAATYVSGTISTNTTWTLANSPYVVSSVTVNSGATLTLDPGTVVKFQSVSGYLTVNGTLNANGTSTDKIYFTSYKDDTVGGDTNGDGNATTPAAGNWSYIWIATGTLNLNHSIVRYGGNASAYGAIYNNDGILNASDSQIAYNYIYGINQRVGTSTLNAVELNNHSSYGMYISGGNATISNSSIHDNPYYGIFDSAGNSANLALEGNTFSNNGSDVYIDGVNFTHSNNNSTSGSGRGFIVNGTLPIGAVWTPDNMPYIAASVTVSSGRTLTIQPGVVVKFQSTGSYFAVNGTLNANGTSTDKIYFTSYKDDTVGGDTNGDGNATTPAAGNWSYIWIATGTVNLNYAVVRYGGFPYGSYGAIYNNGGTLSISNSQIAHNYYYGIYQQSGSLTIISSEISNQPHGVFIYGGNATITGSLIHDNSYYGVYNSTANIINAENNWWGNASGPYHATLNPTGTGNKASNNVDFIPWLTTDPLTVNNLPTFSNPNQYKSDSTTQIPENGITQESSVVFKATLQDQDDEQVKLQVELKEKEQSFNEQDLIESSFVNSGSEAVVSRGSLIAGSYHWRARDIDSRGGTSAWQEFGTAGNIDFTIGRTIKVAVILAEPSDKSFDPSHTKQYFEQNIIPDVKDYYCEVSFGTRGQDGICRDGLVNLVLEVFDNNGVPYKLSQTQQYYGENYLNPIQLFLGRDGNNQSIVVTDSDNTEQFVWDAINKADNDVNYNDYESVVVVYYGDSEQNISLQNYRLSTQEISFSFAPLNTPNEIAKNWISIAESSKSYDLTHEFGHVIGSVIIEKPLFDLYKSALPCNCDYGGDLNDYDVMAGRGIVAELYNYIVHFSSFTKLKLNWLEEDIIDYGSYNIESLETMEFGDKVKRFNISSNSYYLLEARTNNSQYSKWDTGFFENTLVIYKVKPRQMIVKNQSKIIPFVNVSKSIYLPPADFPYRDPVENVKIELTNWSANSFSFRINTKISELNLIDYTGAILKPEIGLLKEISWYITDPLKRIAGGGDAGYSFWDYVLYDVKDGLGQSFNVSLIIILIILVVVKLVVRKKIKRSWLKNILVAIITVVSLLLIFRILSNIGFYAVGGKSNFALADLLRTSSTVNSSVDLDLHAITPDGKHTGVNYQTGEYENQIPGAIASGDLVYDDEWIFVPEGTQVKYYASSYDIQQFLNENPDIAQQLPTTQETYTLSAMYYDSQSQKYESAPLTDQPINPGENIIYEIQGTTDIAITPGIVDSQPPTTSISLSGTTGSGNWYISDVQITLSASDDSGVLKTEYSLDNGQTWTTYSGSFTYDIEGQNTILYRSVDLVGNTEQTKSQEIKLDKTAPTIFASDVSAEQTTEQGTYLEIQASVQDNIDQNPTITADKPLSQTFPAGTTNILLTSADQAGNAAEKTITVTIFSTPTADPDSDCVLNQDDIKPFDGSVFANFTLPQEYSFFEKETFNFPFSAAGVGLVQVSYSDIYYETQENPVKDSQGNSIPTTTISQDGTTTVSFNQSTKQNINYKLTLKTKKGNKQEKQKIAKKKDEETNQEKKQELEKELKFISAPITFAFKSQTCPNTLIQSSNVNIYDKEKKVSIHYKYKDNQEPQLILKTDETIQLTKGQPFVFTVKVTNIPKETFFSASLSGNFTLLETFDEEEHNNKEHRKEKKFYLFYPSVYQGTSGVIAVNLTVGNVSASNTLNAEFED